MSSPEAPQEPLDESQAQATARPAVENPATPSIASPEAAQPPTAQASDQPVQRPQPPQRAPFVSREERDRKRREALAALQVGEWREGRVTGIAAFGAFVDLGGVDGLVHVSQLGTGGYVERVEDVVQVGAVVRVRVAEVDMERGRVSLSMREGRTTGAGGGAPAQRDRPAPPAAPRPPRAPQAGPAPNWSEPPPEQRTDRRSRGSGDRFAGRDERPARRSDRPRRQRDSSDEEWRTLRGDPRGYFSSADEIDEEPAPTTAEELVARFGRKDTSR